MPDELPPLDKFVVSGYSESDQAFPIVVVVKDSRANGYTIPTDLTLCPDSRFSGHKFVGVTPTNIDNRVIWTYELLPGPTLTNSQYDIASNTVITIARTKKLLSTITEGVTQSGSGATAVMVVTESEQITNLLGIEIVTTYPRGDAYSEATAIESEDWLPFQFPMTFDMTMYTAAGVGFATLAFTKRVSHVKKTWWEISATRPTLTLNGEIDFGQSYELFGQNFGGQVIYDEINGQTWGGESFDFPGSTPDFTTYVADWVGGAPRSVLGSVRQDGGKFRWRMEKVFVQYILPTRATLTPP